jgi:catechol 2,3-dioxygenase
MGPLDTDASRLPGMVGHVHLKVRDAALSERFYTEAIGMRVTERVGPFVFLSLSGRHHDLALQGLGPRAETPPAQATGLYHFALEVPDRDALRAAHRRLRENGVEVDAVDHGISWALYFADPDGNGVEIYCDTREVRPTWGGLSSPLDLG